MHRDKTPGIFTPAPSQELFFPELDSGIIIPSYPQESVFLARNNIPEIFRNFFCEKKFLQECLHPKKLAAEEYSRNSSSGGILIPEQIAQNSLPLTSIIQTKKVQGRDIDSIGSQRKYTDHNGFKTIQ